MIFLQLLTSCFTLGLALTEFEDKELFSNNQWILNAQTGIQQCENDGFFNGSACICKESFTGYSCHTRLCHNAGFLRDQITSGCECPPGFLGANCQPVQCVSGMSNSFYAMPSERTVTVLMPLNKDLNNKMSVADDNPVDAICENFANSDLSRLTIIIGTAAIDIERTNDPTYCEEQFKNNIEFLCQFEGENEDGPLKSCPGGDQLTPDQIMVALSKTKPMSQLFIISDTPLLSNDLTNSSTKNVLDNILRSAVALRINIYALMYSPDSTTETNDYYNKENYAALRYLTRGSQGSYITPYSASSNKLLGPSTIKAVTGFLMTQRNLNSDLLAVIPSKSPAVQNYYVGNEFYIMYRSLDAKPENLTFTIPPSNAIVNYLYLDTGFWKVMKLTTTALYTTFSLGFEQNDNTKIPFDVQVLGTTPILASVAITTDNQVDATQSHAPANRTSNLVVRAEFADKNVNINSIKAQFQTVNASFEMNIQSRPGCQFEFSAGSITCDGGISQAFVLQIEDDQKRAAAVPFMCVDEGMPLYSESIEEETQQRVLTKRVIPQENPVECPRDGDFVLMEDNANPQRSFVIVSAAKKSDFTKSLYVNDSSIFQYLVPYTVAYPKLYGGYASNLLDDAKYTNGNNGQHGDDVGGLITNVLEYLRTEDDPAYEDPSNTTLVGGIGYALKACSHAYPDVFIVIDWDISTQEFDFFATLDDISAVRQMALHRARLFFLFVGNSYDYEVLRPFVEFAATSGGSTIEFSDYNDLTSWFSTFFPTTNTEPPVELKPSQDLPNSDLVSIKWVGPNTPKLVSDIFYIRKDSTYFLILRADQQVNDLSLVNSGDASQVAATMTTLGRNNTFAVITAPTSGQYRAIAQFSAFSQQDCVLVIYEGSSDSVLSSAFTSSQSQDYNTAAVEYGTISQQFLVFGSDLATETSGNITTSIYLATSTIGRTNILDAATATPRSASCSMNSWIDQNLRCNVQNAIYYWVTSATADGVRGITRTVPLICVKENNSPCLHGGTQVNDFCECLPGWTGDICQTIVCQNDGTATLTNICNCQGGFYGEYCEYSNSTKTVCPPEPVYSSQVTSLLFVVQDGDSIDIDGWSPTNFVYPGIQFVVVRYGCNEVNGKLWLSSTNPDLITSSLKNSIDTTGTTCTVADLSPVPAIQIAVMAQVGARGLLIVKTPTAFTNLTSLDSLGAALTTKRTDIRVYLQEDSITPEVLTLANLGNGIPYVSVSGSFTKYMSEYIAPMIGRLNTEFTTPRQGLTVLDTEIDCSVQRTYTIKKYSADPTDSLIFIATYGLPVVTPTGCGTQTSLWTSNNFYIYQYTNALDDCKITIAQKAGNCMYSIERMNNYKVSYSFQPGTSKPVYNSGLTLGSNTMWVYSSRSNVGTLVGNIPYLQVKEVFNNGTLTNPVAVASSAPVHCSVADSLQYYEVLQCGTDTLGYQAKLTTFWDNGNARQDQFVLACPQQKVLCETGKGALDANKRCICFHGWKGQDCSMPICENGGTPFGSACLCPEGVSGANCDIGGTPVVGTTVSPKSARAMVFMVDVVGSDCDIFQQTIEVYQRFVSLYDTTKTIILFNTNSKYFSTINFHNYDKTQLTGEFSSFGCHGNSETYLDRSLNVTYSAANRAVQPTLPPADGAVWEHLEITSEYNNIFYITQTGGTLYNPAPLNLLKTEYNFNMGSIALYKTSLDARVEADLTALGDFYKTTSTDDAVEKMLQWAQGSQYPYTTKKTGT